MNICLISQEYPPDTNWGGIATYTQVFAKGLRQMGHSVHVITLATKNEYITDDNGVVVHRVKPSQNKTMMRIREVLTDAAIIKYHPMLDFSKRVFIEITKISKKEKIDVIESPETCAQAYMTFKSFNNVLKVTRLHTPFFWVRFLNKVPDTKYHLIRDYYEREQCALSNVITSPTEAMKKIVNQRWNINNIQVIPNFFEFNNFYNDLNYSIYDKYLKNHKYILYFGRLEYRKGVHILAKALIYVFEKIKNVKAIFVGNDSVYNRTSMRSLIKKSLVNHHKNVLFLDNMQRNYLFPIIENAELVVLPSLWENFPYACLEAMALGKAVLATSGSGYSEIIDNGIDGILCEPNNPHMLSDYIIDCLTKMDLKSIGKRAQEKIKRFSTQLIVKEMLSTYRKFIHEFKH